jgi:hypothetical protein
MRSLLAAILLLTMAPAFAGQTPDHGLVVRHLAPTGTIPQRASYPHMWFYRTEVFNATRHPLRIVWFQAYMKHGGQWVGENVLGRTLRSREFAAWYTDGDPVPNGVIQPGQTAVCDVNWSSGTGPQFVPTKWAFIAVDDRGSDYYAEAAVDKNIARQVDYRHRWQAVPAEIRTQR